MPLLQLSRRMVLGSLAYGIGACSIPFSAAANLLATDSSGWTTEWDEALISRQIATLGKDYDPVVQMLSAYHGSEYSYQSNVRDRMVHPTRNSLEYASLLLYSSDSEHKNRAFSIIQRMLSNQVQDPGSRYFGLWGWYLEELPDQMHSADFNWADFNGSTLLNILLEHESSLPPEVAAGCRKALHNCAISIRNRNVGLNYTNIAFMGTYVTLATAEFLNDSSLLAYAKDRIVRLEATIGVSGSFAEYNSPGYMAVTIGNISRILKYVRDPDSRAIANRLNARAWQHVGQHWHSPTQQLAGPMSRAYSNNIGSPMWIQKGTNNRVLFVTLAECQTNSMSYEATVPTVEWHCPEELIPLFAATSFHQYREIFIAGKSRSGQQFSRLDGPKPPGVILPVEGTTLLTPSFSLGTVNRCDCWVQRRNLIAYWGGPSRPPHTLQLRVMKDDYEFSSALFYAAQDQGYVLGSIRFRSDGGDKHPSLDPIKNGTITLRRMRVQLLFEGWKPEHLILVDGKPRREEAFAVPATSRLAISTGGVSFIFQAHDPRFLDQARYLHFNTEKGDATISVDLMETKEPAAVRLADLVSPGCDFTFQIDDSGVPLESLDSRFAGYQYVRNSISDLRSTLWKTHATTLSVTTSTLVQPLTKHDQSFDLSIDNKPYPFLRLGDT
jgi:hypothetical protein